MNEYLTLHQLKNIALRGEFIIPADKSISHRALILSSQTDNICEIENLLEGEDVIATKNALIALGVDIKKSNNKYSVKGIGIGNLKQPNHVLNMENTGTGCRLLAGLIAANNIEATLDGDASLRSRPMDRILNPLTQIGLQIIKSADGKLPITLRGGNNLKAINYTMPIASAQLKSALLLAGLNINGTIIINEPTLTRDHTEKMLRGYGVNIKTGLNKDGGNQIELQGRQKLKAANIQVPADPSSAAFFAVAALIIPGSKITLKNICINPTRTGIYTSLIEMGGKIEFVNIRKSGGEDIADITVEYSKLHGITIAGSRSASMIDEYPIMAIAAANATGTTVMQDLAELKVKESNRLNVTADNLTVCGINNKIINDDLYVTGGNKITGNCTVKTHMDHRIAMSFLILSLISEQAIYVDDITMIKTSFPNFFNLFNL